MQNKGNKWDWEIRAKTNYWDWSLREMWSYRHLLAGLVRRDFLLKYQQTVIGPLWVLLVPVLTLMTYMLVFGKLFKIPTGPTPPVLFYLSGITLWSLFSESLVGTSNTFRENSRIFSKVYFPRIIVPTAVTSSFLLQALIQLLLLLILITYYWAFHGFHVSLGLLTLAFPIAVLCVGTIGLSLGLILSVLTAKYRDLVSLVNIGIRLFMFVTPVIYPVGSLPDDLSWVVQINPLSPLFELFRLSLLGEGFVTYAQVAYSFLFTLVTLAGALLLFNKQGDKLIDIV